MFCSGLLLLLHICNTRYVWLARPYPVGTSTPQEAPSEAWRTNETVEKGKFLKVAIVNKGLTASKLPKGDQPARTGTHFCDHKGLAGSIEFRFGLSCRI